MITQRTPRSVVVSPVLLAFGLAGLLAGCVQVPITGRSALTLVNHDDVLRVTTVAFEKIKRVDGVSRERRANEQLQRVAARLTPVAFWDVSDADWEFVVLDLPGEVSARSTAGGKVAVSAGCFKLFQNDDQLAWVLAHEIAHMAARHTEERLSRLMMAKGGTVAAVVGLAGAGGAATQAGVQAYELSVALNELSFSRSQELEADYMGLIYMARAGYDPEQGVRVFERMVDAQTAAGVPIPVPMFSTHPASPERTLQLIDQLPKAMEVFHRHKSAAEVKVIR